MARNQKINPKAFDCECCGNQIYKSEVHEAVKCCYCGYINHIGKYERRKKGAQRIYEQQKI